MGVDGNQGGEGPAGPFVPWAALDGAMLDEAIRPLVEALNGTGWVRTVFSCAGHPEELDSIKRGRRQAHVDVLLSDRAQWRRVVGRCRHDAKAAVRGLGLPGVSFRVAEGSLGPLPPWLEAAIEEGESGGLADPRPGTGDALPWWLRAARRVVPTLGQHWQYRRLALEPVPYGLPPDQCRLMLDAALAATVAVLQSG